MADDGSDAEYGRALRELMAAPPADFVARRSEHVTSARSRGDVALAARLSAVRKPALPAWAVNLLVAHHPDEVVGLVELGRTMRARQQIDPLTLREFRVARTDRLRELVSLVRSEAAVLGVRLAPASIAEVERTLGAALSEEESALAVLAGTLAAPLRYAGLGPRLSTTEPPAPPPRVTAALLTDTIRRSLLEQQLDAAAESLAIAVRADQIARRDLAAAALRVAAVEQELTAATDAEALAEQAVAETDERRTAAELLLARVRQELADLDAPPSDPGRGGE